MVIEQIRQYLPIVIPMVFVALRDLKQQPAIRGPKRMRAFFSCLLGLFSSLAYSSIGSKEKNLKSNFETGPRTDYNSTACAGLSWNLGIVQTLKTLEKLALVKDLRLLRKREHSTLV